VATIGILQQQAIRRSEVVTEQLQTALNSRVIIEQAKGVLAHHYGLTMEAAIDRLRRYTRNRHLHLAEVAQQIAGRRLHHRQAWLKADHAGRTRQVAAFLHRRVEKLNRQRVA
jgi:hypothetical protein